MKKEKTLKRTTQQYRKTLQKNSLPTKEALMDLRAYLLMATQHTGQYCSAEHMLHKFRLQETQTEPNIFMTLPDFLPNNSEELAYSHETVVESSPTSIIRVPHATFKANQDSGFKEEVESLYQACETMNDISLVEKSTRGRANNKEWFVQRHGAITATKLFEVMEFHEKRKKKCESLIRDILSENTNDKLRNVPAIKWGRKNEENAHQCYMDKFLKYHANLSVSMHG
ncbi:hypothetical protein DPMN_069759 [Dreissena polymorpha]|uniref:Uncharacterized protein n=1 Tax=Dreissena polymorpha TaxID=45954 RepID=A0A9D4BV67_DREPO|nr:hypothetical protein DPMN_069759 [Dreissena polymorpha]